MKIGMIKPDYRTKRLYSPVYVDNVIIDKAAEELIGKTFGKKVLELMGLQIFPVRQDRHNGFTYALKESDLQVITDIKWLEPNARKEMESALSRFDEINLVYGHNDPATHGAYLAAKAAGREGEMMFIGIDALPHEGVPYEKMVYLMQHSCIQQVEMLLHSRHLKSLQKNPLIKNCTWFRIIFNRKC